MAVTYRKFWKWIGEGEGQGAAGAAGAATAEGGEQQNGEEKKFTQKQVDDIINKRFGKEKGEKENLVKQLEKFKESQGLSEKEKTDLQSQIDALNESMRTKEEQSQFEKKQLETKFKTEVDTLLKDRDTWKNRFNESSVKRSLTDAAITAGAEHPDQLVLMYTGQTRLEEEKDEGGKLTGSFVSKTKIQGIDPETKKMITLDLPTSEAFQKMREMGWNKNLFKHGAAAGTGQGSGGQGGNGRDPSKMPAIEDYPNNPQEFQKAYTEWRAKYNLDGSPKSTK